MVLVESVEDIDDGLWPRDAPTTRAPRSTAPPGSPAGAHRIGDLVAATVVATEGADLVAEPCA